MTPPEKRDAESESPRHDTDDANEEQKPKKPEAGDYSFKVKPVNRKNSFDFEDVADK